MLLVLTYLVLPACIVDVTSLHVVRLKEGLHAGVAAGPQQRQQPGDHWWQRLPVVCMPVRELTDGGFGFLTADLFDDLSDEGGEAERDGALKLALVAFEDRDDAQQVQWLWDGWECEEEGQNRCTLATPPLSFLGMHDTLSESCFACLAWAFGWSLLCMFGCKITSWS